MLLIKNGKIVTMAGINYENGTILIKNGKIIEVGEQIIEQDNMEIIDAKGGWVLPGLIDAHCHLGMIEEEIGAEGNDLNEMSDPLTPHLRALDGINPLDPAFREAVKAGITTVMSGPGSTNVIGGQFIVIKTKGVSADEMAVMQPAALKIALGENPKRIYKGKNKMPMTRMGTTALLRETLIKGLNYKTKKDRAQAKGDNFDLDIKMEALIPVLEKKIPLKAHAHRADDILTAIRIAKEFDVSLTIDHCTDGNLIVEQIKSSGAPVILGPSMTFRTKIETKNKSFDTAVVLNNAGVKLALMTDHPVTPIEYLPICAGLAVKAGLSMEDGLKSITINAAEILGVSNRIGSIEKGKDADIAIYDGNPMEIFTNTLYTIINGRIAYKK
ncbi:amidohydrolase [Clostridiaceae bacterium UIB06]|uniref:Amidohydrolase n=1 Tax=Clostridium thailandense TaxID=2794346 RepID=A0A949TH48_9CLOT|nr:amidohydrolase [Clostridium thailandense]MBV7272694.1 amidohydrolase [Clostridium thailandense]MCH5137863.1 amidohydrolase [Clostridiaceae bacterium UIB06]